MIIRIAGLKYKVGTRPDPEVVRAAREAAKHTQLEAIRTVHRDRYQTWQRWESETAMLPAEFGYYLMRTGQWPVG